MEWMAGNVMLLTDTTGELKKPIHPEDKGGKHYLWQDGIQAAVFADSGLIMDPEAYPKNDDSGIYMGDDGRLHERDGSLFDPMKYIQAGQEAMR